MFVRSLGGSGCAEETGGVRAEHTAWVWMKKRRRRREEEESHSPPAATNMHFKDDTRLPQLLLWFTNETNENG